MEKVIIVSGMALTNYETWQLEKYENIINQFQDYQSEEFENITEKENSFLTFIE